MRGSRVVVLVLAGMAVVAVVAVAVGAVGRRAHPSTSKLPCVATAGAAGSGAAGSGAAGGGAAGGGAAAVKLAADQALHATTIAAVGKRLGLPDHAVTVALAAALQESGLHNLDHGDLDSAGLFQQRPSQGWGTRTEIMSPVFAAAAFYQRLAQVPDWQTLAVTEAAQAVQHSAAPNAYAQWEGEARLLARTLTGEVGAGFTCRVHPPHGQLLSEPLAAAMQAELGPPALDVVVDPARGWIIASWLVARVQLYRISSVTFSDRTWKPASGSWELHAPTSSSVHITSG